MHSSESIEVQREQFFLQQSKRIRRIQHHCHLRDQKNNYNVILHVINYINLGLFTILDVSINQDSPIAPLEVDREGPELCSSSFGLIQTQSCTLCPYQFLDLSDSSWVPCSKAGGHNWNKLEAVVLRLIPHASDLPLIT